MQHAIRFYNACIQRLTQLSKSVENEEVFVEKLPYNCKRHMNHPCKFHCYCNYISWKNTGGISFVRPWYVKILPVNEVHCYHGMARPHVADGGDGQQVRRAVVNILNKQSRTADRGWTSSLEAGRRDNNPHRNTPYLLRNVLKSLG
jgi:hypothetical protein